MLLMVNIQEASLFNRHYIDLSEDWKCAWTGKYFSRFFHVRPAAHIFIGNLFIVILELNLRNELTG